MQRILIVDDSAVDRRLALGLLKNAGNWRIDLAENAETALRLLDDTPFDVVLTDLRMPGMNGLELLQTLRERFARLPVVLMTAEGSENLAVDALRLGAASYVPKPRLSDLLVEVLNDVLGLVRADRAHSDLVRCLDKNEFSFVLHNDPALIGPLVDLVQQMVSSTGLCGPAGRVRLAVALEQALLNGMLRGNLELRPEDAQNGDTTLLDVRRTEPFYADRDLHVEVTITPQEARIVVEDEGLGFAAPDLSGEEAAIAMERDEGRGLVLMRSCVDEVIFNERGNQVTLIKRRENSERQAAVEVAEPAAEPPTSVRWGDLTTGSRVTDSISGRTYRVYRNEVATTLSSPGGDSLTFSFDEMIDKNRYRVYML